MIDSTKWYDDACYKLFRRQLVVDMGDWCNHCGWNIDIRALVLDHIDGDGHLDRKRGGKGRIYQQAYYGRHPKKLQVLCCNCNWLKALNNGEIGAKKVLDNTPTVVLSLRSGQERNPSPARSALAPPGSATRTPPLALLPPE